MGIILAERIVAWEDDEGVYCVHCGNDDMAPLTMKDFDYACIVVCDECDRRILTQVEGPQSANPMKRSKAKAEVTDS